MGDKLQKVHSNITFSREDYDKLTKKADEVGVSLSEIISRALNEYIQPEIISYQGFVSERILPLKVSPDTVENEKTTIEQINTLFTDGWTHELRTKLIRNGSANTPTTPDTPTARMGTQSTKYYR